MPVTSLYCRRIRPGFVAWSYEDDDTRERDLDFYLIRPVTKAELRARYVYSPSPEDVTFTFSLEPDLAAYLMGWCKDMEVTPERFIHALIRAVRKYDNYPWEKE